MRIFIAIVLLWTYALASEKEYLPITTIHVESFVDDSMYFDLQFDRKGKAVSSTIYCFKREYVLSPEELRFFENVPIINYCYFEKGTAIIQPQEIEKIKKCIADRKCEYAENKQKAPLRYLYIHCGKGNENSVLLRFGSDGKLYVE